MRRFSRDALDVAGLMLIGMLLVLYGNERDARERAESHAIQLADVVTDMLQYQVDQVNAKTFRLEIITEKSP